MTGADSDELIGTLAALQEAATERDLFEAFHRACDASFGAVSISAHVVTRHGMAVEHVIEIGELGLPFDPGPPVTRWLLDGEPFPTRRTTEGHLLLALSLPAEGQPRGGLLVAGPQLGDPRHRHRCTTLARVAAATLATIEQRRFAQLVREVLDESEEAISIYDSRDGIVFTNQAYHRIFPHYPEPSRLLGFDHLALYRMDLEAGIIDDPLAKADPKAYLEERRRRSEQLVTRQREVQSIGRRSYIYTRSRSKTGATMSRRIDITDQVATEAKLRERERELQALAFRDPLTGLYNRTYFFEALKTIERRLHEGRSEGVAIALVDLNGFKSINDTYGPECGDLILKTVAGRIRALVAKDDIVVRLGADEFVVVVEGGLALPALHDLAAAVIEDLARPIACGDVTLTTGATIAIACRAGREADLGTIVADADLAMNEARKAGTGGALIYHPGLRADIQDRLSLLGDLRQALRNDQFDVWYQPQFAAHDSRLLGFEALSRWRHPKRGPIPPSVFIPMLEEQGLIGELGEAVLRRACADAAGWAAPLNVAVNVSPLQVRNRNFALVIAEALMRSGLAPHRLELEVTESVFIGDEERACEQLRLWKTLGLRLALDDFGNGYSSLGYLSAFPIDKLKIDRGFVARLSRAAPDKAANLVLRAIIDLGRALDMTVTAEGVERADQLEILRDWRCSEIQGYLLGRPMPAVEAKALAASAAALSAPRPARRSRQRS